MGIVRSLWRNTRASAGIWQGAGFVLRGRFLTIEGQWLRAQTTLWKR